jgi:hypothetical protein
MKDFVSKITFGFLMAQLLPGAVIVFAVSSFFVETNESDALIRQIIFEVAEIWTGTTFKIILFLFISVGAGMLIHGLNWTVLAWIEHKCPNHSVRDHWFWHKKTLCFQLLFSPLQMFAEIAMMFFAPNLGVLIMNENVSHLNSDKMSQFTFLQEFYLHFVMDFCLTWFLSLLVFYFLSSAFFLLGRIQSGSLFEAEQHLVDSVNSSQGSQESI